MGRQINELLHTGLQAFAFLVDEHGFNGPETGASRLTYRRAAITISVRIWAWKNETGFTTTITVNADGDLSTHFADLSCLYMACGLGPLQHVTKRPGADTPCASESPSTREHSKL